MAGVHYTSVTFPTVLFAVKVDHSLW